MSRRGVSTTRVAGVGSTSNDRLNDRLHTLMGMALGGVSCKGRLRNFFFSSGAMVRHRESAVRGRDGIVFDRDRVAGGVSGLEARVPLEGVDD